MPIDFTWLKLPLNSSNNTYRKARGNKYSGHPIKVLGVLHRFHFLYCNVFHHRMSCKIRLLMRTKQAIQQRVCSRLTELLFPATSRYTDYYISFFVIITTYIRGNNQYPILVVPL